ncbi:MAG: sulfite reductase subunit alpha [Lautropia sp.]|nr:sulfite reductase subunit alpha [Lautropia sp.]
MTTPHETPATPAPQQPGVLMVYASQSGSAESLAHRSAQQLRQRGIPVSQIIPLQDLDADRLKQGSLALFVVSTTGEGNAPDNAAIFVDTVMSAHLMPPKDGESSWLHLPSLQYGLLALGDRSYMNFCGFGRQLDEWLQEHGASPLFDRIEVDCLDADALDAWEAAIQASPRLDALTVPDAADHAPTGTHPLASTNATAQIGTPREADDPATLSPPAAGPWQRWQLQARQCLNTGSLVGQPIHHLSLVPADGQPLPSWEAGDIARILHDSESPVPREYSIASIPADGRLDLLVREEKRADGSPGLVSGWLCTELMPGATLDLSIRPNPGFHQKPNRHRPLILIGNGSGMAGLRAHLRERATLTASSTAPCWLIFGERQAAHDQLYRDETDAWQASGVLAHVDRVFSRDGQPVRYVQDVLEQQAGRLREWVDTGAAIHVCGSRQGMGDAVDATLKRLLTEKILHALIREGRYRRDVY